MKTLIALLLAGLGNAALAAEPQPNLPPDEVVAGVLRANPMVNAASSQITVEEANRRRLEAGQYEWNVRLGGQQRKTTPNNALDERFNEWNAALERPVRLPGKASLDAELGAAGVSLAETAHGDALTGILAGPGAAWADVREAIREPDVATVVTTLTDAIGESTAGARVACHDPACGRDDCVRITPVPSRRRWRIASAGCSVPPCSFG